LAIFFLGSNSFMCPDPFPDPSILFAGPAALRIPQTNFADPNIYLLS
jgi:hypothetical protein